MTTIRLALSATTPGVWTGSATRYHYSDTVGPADDFGNPAGDPASQGETVATTASVALLNAANFDVYEQQVFDDVTFGGTRLKSAAGLVTMTSYTDGYGLQTGDAPGYLQTITADGPWNLIKDIAVSSLSSQAVTISNFVDVQVDTGNDPAAHVIDIEDAKRGTITVAGSAEQINLKYLSNEYAWSNTFDVQLGDGNNDFFMVPVDPYSAGLVQPLTPMTFNTAPQLTRLDLTTGNGKNVIQTRENSDSIHLGHGFNSVTMMDGHNEVWTSGGQDTISIESHSLADRGTATDIGSDLLHLGAESAQVFVDDTTLATMPQTTVELTASPLGSSPLAGSASATAITFTAYT